MFIIYGVGVDVGVKAACLVLILGVAIYRR